MNNVSHTQNNPSEKNIKQSAKAIQSALKEIHNFNINHTQALEISARSYGFKNWNVASAASKKKGHEKAEFQNNTPEYTPRVSVLDSMTKANRSHFMSVIRECASSVRLSHLDSIESVKNNVGIIDNMLQMAILRTYDRMAEKANMGDLIKAIKDTALPLSLQSAKEEILYILSSKDPNNPINYYGAVIKSAEDGIRTNETELATSIDNRMPSNVVHRLHLMEAHFKKIGYPLLETACKAIVGGSNNGTSLSVSVNEEGMKESEGVWHAVWVPHKIAILQKEDLFKEVAAQFGFDATSFLNKINKEISDLETFLSGKPAAAKESYKEEERSIDRIQSIFEIIENIPQASKEMHSYINSLDKRDYALLATTYDLGRQGWERHYYETSEYEGFVEEMASNGHKVTQEISDRKFLPKSKKLAQFNLVNKHMLNNAVKYNGSYNHDWLSGKINLIHATQDGIKMLTDII